MPGLRCQCTQFGNLTGSIEEAADFGCDSVVQSGAPPPTKMGTTVSQWCYDGASPHAIQSANLRRPAILRCATSADALRMQKRCNWMAGTEASH